MTRGCTKYIEHDFPQPMGINKWLELMGGVQEMDAPVELDIKGLKSASKALESKRFKGSGTLLVCAESLCNLTTRKLGYATCHVPLPSETKMMNDLTQCATQTGCFDWHLAQACGDAYKVVREILGVCENWEVLRDLNVLFPEQVLSPTCLKEDLMVCKYVFELAKNSAIGEIKTQSFYSERPPYAFLVWGHRWSSGETYIFSFHKVFSLESILSKMVYFSSFLFNSFFLHTSVASTGPMTLRALLHPLCRCNTGS